MDVSYLIKTAKAIKINSEISTVKFGFESKINNIEIE
jgi:hypothetical protein